MPFIVKICSFVAGLESSAILLKLVSKKQAKSDGSSILKRYGEHTKRVWWNDEIAIA